MDIAERFEFKFLITQEQRDQVLEALGGELQPDANGGSGGVYPIVSLYYDTLDWRCYWEAWQGMASRRKLRVRVYGTADGKIAPTSFVEVKHKVDGRGVKRRVQTSLENALQIGAGAGQPGAFSASDGRIIEEVHRLVHHDGFRPACTMRYRRHAYFLPVAEPAPGTDRVEPLRITFDDDLGVRFDTLLPEPDDRRFRTAILPPGQMIMEMKGFGSVPYAITRRLAQSRIVPRSFSKYRTAVSLQGAHHTPRADSTKLF
jgi:hypothetical protein